MRDAKLLLIPAMLLAFAACQGEPQPEANQVITDINAAGPGDIEALPPDESVDPLADSATDPRSPEERGDGDDMVNIVDDTANRN